MISTLELEITGRCPLECDHCYAHSGPTAGHGSLSDDDWRHVIDQAAELGSGMIQFIGGEPMARYSFPNLLRHALTTGVKVEVFSNLFHVKNDMWDLLTHPRVSLATSYYSDQADDHDAVTRRPGSHARTRANIAEALRRSIPLRVGIIDVHDGQRVAQAVAELAALGVENVSTDRMRGVGRGARKSGTPEVTELCGRCGRGKAAVSPDGDVWPCVLSRWMCAGNVQTSSLADILCGPEMTRLVSTIPEPPTAKCNPDCKPSQGDGSDCAPAETTTCNPSFCKPDHR